MIRNAILAVVASLLLAPLSHAGIQGTDHLRVESAGTTPLSFEAQREALLTELERGERYSEINARDRARVVESLDRMASWLQASGSIEGMNEQQRIRLFNEQEKINVLLTEAAENSRMVCSREPTVGTRLQRSICFTVAERRRRQQIDAEGVNSVFVGDTQDCYDMETGWIC